MVPVMVRYATAAVTVLVLIPAGASAQDSEAPASDPEADSPSGTVYELPLDRGRKDAAPRKRPRRNAAKRPVVGSRRGPAPTRTGDGGGGTDSPIRSENNFGSSSQVPGVDEDRADAGGVTGGGSGDGNNRGGATGDSPSGESSGSDRSARSTAAIGVDPAGGSSDGPSWGLIVPLIAVLLLLGVTAGTLAGRARRS